MPTYTYFCPECQSTFELSLLMCDYKDTQICTKCDYTQATRALGLDIQTLQGVVTASDGEIKLGQLAERNSKRMSRDEKIDKCYEQNKYKYEGTDKNLPDGMTRINKKDKDSVMKKIEEKIK